MSANKSPIEKLQTYEGVSEELNLYLLKERLLKSNSIVLLVKTCYKLDIILVALRMSAC